MATTPGTPATSASTDYSFAGLENLWIKNGGSAEWAPTMAAIALSAESGGDPTAENASGATGIWQILSSAQSAAFNAQHPPSTMTDPNANARAAIALLGDGSGISNWGSGTGDSIGTAVQANGNKPLTPQQAQQYATQGATTNATLDSDVTDTSPSQVTAGPTKLTPPMAGVDIKNFHGYDLSAFAGGDSQYLGEAEQAILKFISDPKLESLVVANNPTDNAEYGYSSFSLKIPQLNAVMITTALAPNANFDENTLQGIISNTDWYKKTDQNQRTYEAALVSDPSSAHDALVQAQDKVLATANQVGVKLTKTQLDQIANVYAAQSYTPTNILGSDSGTSQEWLDQAVVNTALNIKATGSITPGGTTQQYDYAGGTTDISSTTNPQDLSGITQQLFTAFQTTAQNYLLYNPTNPGASLLTNQDLMADVTKAMQQYTGTGSSGLASEFVNNANAQFTQQAMAQAKSVYPTLGTLIDQGTTPQAYITPLTNYVGSQLGMTQGQINVQDPQWNWLISTPGKDGTLGPVTQDQALQKITDPNFSWTDPHGQQMTYLQTDAGQQVQNQFSQQFASAFGKGA